MNVNDLFAMHFQEEHQAKRSKHRREQRRQRDMQNRINHFIRLGYSEPEARKKAGDDL